MYRRNRLLVTLIFAALISTLISCQLFDKCRGSAGCSIPPGALRIRILDNSGNDLLYDGLYYPDSIKLYYDHGTPVNYDLVGSVASLVVVLNSEEAPLESAKGNDTFYLQLNSRETDSILLNVQPYTLDCCTAYQWKDVKIDGKVPEYDSLNYAYIIRK